MASRYRASGRIHLPPLTRRKYVRFLRVAMTYVSLLPPPPARICHEHRHKRRYNYQLEPSLAQQHISTRSICNRGTNASRGDVALPRHGTRPVHALQPPGTRTGECSGYNYTAWSHPENCLSFLRRSRSKKDANTRRTTQLENYFDNTHPPPPNRHTQSSPHYAHSQTSARGSQVTLSGNPLVLGFALKILHCNWQYLL
jgi:hypothetical protein